MEVKSERVKSEKFWGALLLLCCAFVLCSCNRPALYEYQAVSHDGWLSTDTLRYELKGVPHDGWYSLTLGVRYDDTYAYDDLWLVVERRLGDHSRLRDTLHMTALQDTVGWQPRGSVLHEHEEMAAATRFTTQQMPVRLLVYHIMQRQRLTGIVDVGLKVE